MSQTPTEGFNPQYSEQETRHIISQFDINPTRFSEEQKEVIRHHAVHHRVPFYEGEASLSDAIKQAAGGFVEGFTTLNILGVDPPDNKWSNIAREMGHLAGFAPGILAKPLQLMGATRTLVQGAQALNKASIPMVGAKWTTDLAKKYVDPAIKAVYGKRALTAAESAKGLLSTEKIYNMAEGGFNLGVASAISSWQGGVDEMMHAFTHGAGAGAFFKGLGDYVNTGNPKFDVQLRALSGALFTGLPATQRGLTDAEQIYQYLMGAYFGGAELPWAKRMANREFVKMQKKAKKDPQFALLAKPELMEGYKDLPAVVQKEFQNQYNKVYKDVDTNLAIGWELADALGIGTEVQKAQFARELVTTGKVVHGEETYRLTRQGIETGEPIFKFTGVSGGAKGSDTLWGVLVNKAGGKMVHYTFKDHAKNIKPGEGAQIYRKLSRKELDEATIEVRDAAELIDKVAARDMFKSDLLKRNFHIVKYSDTIYGVGTIEGNKFGANKRVAGGTGWTVGMAINNKKPVYIFDPAKNRWFRWDYNTDVFSPIKASEVAKMKEQPGLIGARFKGGDVPVNAKQAMMSLINRSYGTKLQFSKTGQIIDPTPKIKPVREPAPKIEESDTVDKTKTSDVESLSVNDADIGMRLNPAGKTSIYIAREFLKENWQNAPDPQGEMMKIASRISDKINNFTRKGSLENLSEEWADAVNAELRTTYGKNAKELNLKSRQLLRQWMTRANLGLPLDYLTVEPNSFDTKKQVITNIKVKEGYVPRSPAGVPKRATEPLKRVDVVYKQAGGKEKRAYAVLDHVIVTDKNGKRIEISLSRFRDRKWYGKDGANLYDAFTARSMKELIKKNYFLFGGRGDKNAQFWVKLHPALRGKGLEGSFLKSKKFLMDAGILNHPDVKALRDAFVRRYVNQTFENVKLLKDEGLKLHDIGMANHLMYGLQMNGLQPTKANLQKMLGQGFVTGAKNANKRAQIWFTPAWSGNKDFVANYLNKSTDAVNDLSKEGNYRYTIEDFKKTRPKEWKKIKATDLEEHIDGAIIVRDDVVDAINADFGMPKSGQNKSFIVSPSKEHGALLGKFMFHAAGPKQSADMKKKGLHMIMPISAVKQRGTREFNKVYNDLSPEHVLGNYSVKQDSHMLKAQRAHKQLLTALRHYNSFSKSDQKTIDNMFEGLIGNRVRGTKEGNDILDNYIGNKTTENLDKVMKNIDSIGMDKMLNAIHDSNNTMLAERFYRHVFKTKVEDIESEFQEGLRKPEDREEGLQRVQDFDTATDRIIKSGFKWAAKMREKGMDVNSLALLMHKDVADYRIQVVRNWIVNEVARPRVKNSIASRMRPYDKYLQKDADKVNPRLKELQKNDEIFFLDEAYKKVIIETDIPGFEKQTLEKVYKAVENPTKAGISVERHAQLKEVLRAVVMRVPMDSLSGAHALEFAGFTGRKGHGILVHPKTMQALGGADLDGDEAFTYFGGKGGFKKEWKDMYAANKREYYAKDGSGPADNKGPFRRTLTIGSQGEKEKKFAKLMDSPYATYSPFSRIMLSESAASGRDLLGQVVSSKQVYDAAYNSMMEAPNKESWSDGFKVWNKQTNSYETYEARITPKENPAQQAHARALARAQVAFASDPMDELGLRSRDFFDKSLFDAHFNVDYYKRVGDKRVKTNLDLWKYNSYIIKKTSLVGKMRDFNAAYFGRNWVENRKYSLEEIKRMTEEAVKLPSEQMNTILPKIARITHGLDWSDGLAARVNKQALSDLYIAYNNGLAKNKVIKKLLGRTSLDVLNHPNIMNTLRDKLFNHTNRLMIIRNFEKFKKAIAGTTEAKMTETELRRLFSKPEEAMLALERVARDAEWMMSNDMTDMVTTKLVTDLINKLPEKGRDALIEKIHKKTDELKKESWIAAIKRKRFANSDIPPEFVRDLIKISKEVGMDIVIPERFKQGKLGKGERTATLDQADVDYQIALFKRINKIKKGSTKDKLFDTLMLGSLRRGDLQKIQAYEKSVKKMTPLERDVLSFLKSEAARTGTSRLGFSSRAINDANIELFTSEFSKLFPLSKARENTSTKAEKKIINDTLEKLDKDNVEGRPERELDPVFEKALISGKSGFKGLKKGKLTQEEHSLIAELATNLKSYNNKIGADLNELARGITGKDMNLMNWQDWNVMNNTFRDLKGGSLWQKIFRDSKGTPTIKKRFWWLFPRAVNREVMKNDILFLPEKGFFWSKQSLKTGKPSYGQVRKPTWHLEVLQDYIGNMNNLATEKSDEWITKSKKDLLFLEGIKEGEDLRQMAVRVREVHPKHFESIRKHWTMSEANKQRAISSYVKEFNKMDKEIGYTKNLKNKKFLVTNEKGERVSMTGEQIVNKVNKIYNQQVKDMYKIIRGEEGIFEKLKMDEGYFDKAKTLKKINWRKFITYITKLREQGKNPTEVFGVDGLRVVAKSMLYELTPPGKAGAKMRKQMEKVDVSATNQLPTEGYWPHMFFDRATAMRALNARIKELKKMGKDMPPEDMAKLLSRIVHQHHSMTGDWMSDHTDMFQAYDVMESIALKKSERKGQVRWFSGNERFGNMHSRGNHLEGHSVDQAVMETYMRNVSNTYFRQLAQIFSRAQIHKFHERFGKQFKDPKATASWSNYFKLYVQDALGHPTVIPERMYNDPDMKLQGTPYAAWADNRVADRLTDIKRKLGFKEDMRLPEELRKIDLETLRHWSNLEAKFELASLLAHPKSAITNLFGGSVLTLQSAGLTPFRKAANYKWIMSNIDPQFDSWAKIEKFAVKHGAVPEFMISEFGLHPQMQKGNNKKFIEAVAKRLAGKEKAELDKPTIREMAKQYRVTDQAVNFAAKFMSLPERILRTHSFMSHYIKAWESFGGGIKDVNHPVLIELAKKGVKATQFLYSAPYRPAFSRSALGKVMTRFQLWAWNSVRFRNDVLREAKIYGFTPGTDAYKKFVRTAQIDLFSIALAQAFAYSIFDNGLPQPYAWFQDTANWVFGDERERNRAFFGAWPRDLAPLQLITPVFLRAAPPLFRAWVEDDYSRLGWYYVAPMFPFGRIAKDVHKTIDNPIRTMENMFGIPLMDVHRYMKQEGRETPGPGKY